RTRSFDTARPDTWNSRLIPIALMLSFLCLQANAQHSDRLTAPIDGHKSAGLRGTRDARVERLPDEGALEWSTPVRGLGFRFRPSAQQSAELTQLLEDQQNPSSPLYHRWLTPEEYGDRFGLSPTDLSRVTDWLQAQGFHVESTARSRTWVTFSAT